MKSRCYFLDLFLSGKTFINISLMDEGSEFVVNCVTGSVFYRINQTQVQWIIITRETNLWETRSESPLQIVDIRHFSHEVNKSFVSVASRWDSIRSLVKFGQNSLSLIYHCKSLFIHCFLLSNQWRSLCFTDYH